MFGWAVVLRGWLGVFGVLGAFGGAPEVFLRLRFGLLETVVDQFISVFLDFPHASEVLDLVFGKLLLVFLSF